MKVSVPTPGPEVARLGYFVGSWFTEGKILPGSWGEGGDFSWTENTEWMPGGFFVIGRWHFNMPQHLGGNGEEIFVMGWDDEQQVYTFDAFTSQGHHQVSRGELWGSTWIWTSSRRQGANSVRQKYTIETESDKSYRVKFEICEDGVTWLPFMEGRARKT